MLIKYKLTLVYFLVEHGQQHVVVGREQLVDPGSLKKGAENLQQLDVGKKCVECIFYTYT